MQIDPNNPVGNLIQGLEKTPAAGSVNREKEEATEQQTTDTEIAPDYRLSLSEQSKKSMEQLGQPGMGESIASNAGLNESDAQQLAGRISMQLTQQPNTSLTNLAIQKAVDLFT
jgi:hypothetical protein